jgi:hypothetical protein
MRHQEQRGHDNLLVINGRLAGWLAGGQARAGLTMNPINQELYRIP